MPGWVAEAGIRPFSTHIIEEGKGTRMADGIGVPSCRRIAAMKPFNPVYAERYWYWAILGTLFIVLMTIAVWGDKIIAFFAALDTMID
jgi:hypothetical protein